MSLPLLAGDYATQLWQRPPSGVDQPLAYGLGGVIFGSEETNCVIWVEGGSYLKLTQTGNYDGAMLVRVRGSFRANTKQTEGTWRFLVRSDSSTEYNEDWTASYREGWEQRFDDLGINISPHTGSRALQVGLYYVGTDAYQVLPTACCSAIQLETVDTEVALLNRFPSPGATRVPHDLSTWRLDIADFTGNGVDLARTVLHVNGYKVYDAGDVGAYSSATSLVGPGSQTLRFELTVDPALPAYAFLSEATWRVSVSTYTVGGTDVYEEDYSFVMDDILAPTIAYVESVTPAQVRVVWDDSMRADGSVYAADNLENYVFTPVTVPAYTPTILTVTQESASSYTLDLDQELTFGATYELLASSYVQDHVGNPVDLQGRARTFVAATPDSMSGRSLRLVARVPAYNLEQSPDDLTKFLESLQDTTDVLAVQVDRWSDILEAQEAPVAFVDAMLSYLWFPFFWENG